MNLTKTNMEWIDVTIDMPKPFQVVMVSGGVGLWTGSKWNTITGCQWPGETIAWEVTHWAELQYPPKIEAPSIFDQLAAITKP